MLFFDMHLYFQKFYGSLIGLIYSYALNFVCLSLFLMKFYLLALISFVIFIFIIEIKFHCHQFRKKACFYAMLPGRICIVTLPYFCWWNCLSFDFVFSKDFSRIRFRHSIYVSLHPLRAMTWINKIRFQTSIIAAGLD